MCRQLIERMQFVIRRDHSPPHGFTPARMRNDLTDMAIMVVPAFLKNPYGLTRENIKSWAEKLTIIRGWPPVMDDLDFGKSCLSEILHKAYKNWVEMSMPYRTECFFKYLSKRLSDKHPMMAPVLSKEVLWKAFRISEHYEYVTWESRLNRDVFPAWAANLEYFCGDIRIGTNLAKEMAQIQLGYIDREWRCSNPTMSSAIRNANRDLFDDEDPFESDTDDLTEDWPAVGGSLIRKDLAKEARAADKDNKKKSTKSAATVKGNSSMFGYAVQREQSQFFQVDVVDSGNSLNDDDNVVIRHCTFCNKEVRSLSRYSELLSRIAGGRFYCHFCVSRDHHTRKSKHVMLLSMRAMIGYLYHFCYGGKVTKLYVREIEDLITAHWRIGTLNPVFSYDYEAYVWAIDFQKVGDSPRRLPVAEVMKTVAEMISAFNPYANIQQFNGHRYLGKFNEAITDFYSKRYRPQDKLICIPTLQGCATDVRDAKETTTNVAVGYNNNFGQNKNQEPPKKFDLVAMRSFLPRDLEQNYRR